MSKDKKIKMKKMKTINYHLKSIFLLAFSGWFLWNVANELITTVQIQNKIFEAEILANEIQKERESLEKQKEMLQDPNYAMNYARGKLLISKDGEQIFSLNDEDK